MKTKPHTIQKVRQINEVASTDLHDLYEGEYYTHRYHNSAGARITRVLDFIKFQDQDKVLDVGCGNGLLLPEIADKIKHYDGVDFSKTFIERAKQRAVAQNISKNKYNYYCGDVITFCRNKKGYDKVFALDFTEHINDQELKNIFSAVKNSMAAGGQLVIHTPNKDFLLERLKSREHKVKVQGHIGLRNTQEYINLFKNLGFKKVKVIPLSHYIRVMRPLHLLSYIPNKNISSLFQARLLVVCEV